MHKWIHRERILGLLRTYEHSFEEERSTAERIRVFLNSSEDFFTKANLPGQVTASAVPFRRDSREILFIWHEKLQRWLQPGGHVEPEDHSLQAAALRELLEETALREEHVLNFEVPELIDLDIHEIPENGPYPAHLHHDFRFMYEIDPAAGIPVKHRWFSIAELKEWEDDSIGRYADKLNRALQA